LVTPRAHVVVLGLTTVLVTASPRRTHSRQAVVAHSYSGPTGAPALKNGFPVRSRESRPFSPCLAVGLRMAVELGAVRLVLLRLGARFRQLGGGISRASSPYSASSADRLRQLPPPALMVQCHEGTQFSEVRLCRRPRDITNADVRGEFPAIESRCRPAPRRHEADCPARA